MTHSKLIATALLVGNSTMYAAVDTVSAWNTIAVQATLTAGENAVVQSRTLAIIHVAIHDALNSINSRLSDFHDVHSATLLNNGQVLLIGGGVASAELYQSH
jgi:hypothetical protein